MKTATVTGYLIEQYEPIQSGLTAQVHGLSLFFDADEQEVAKILCQTVR